MHATSFVGDIPTALKEAVLAQLPEAEVTASGGGGHFELVVVSPRFAGLGTLAKQRMVYAAIAHLMKGDDAPVHAIDRMECRAP